VSSSIRPALELADLPLAGPGRPQRNLDLQWRPYSLLLRDGTQGLQDWKVAIRTASHRAVRVMAALGRDDPAGVPRFYEALLPRTVAAVNAGSSPFADLDGALEAAGLAPSYATAADNVAWDEPIRQSMAEAFAAAGGVVGTPTIVLDQDPPVGFLGPVLAAPPTGPEALRLWDALVALAAVPGGAGALASSPATRRSRGCAYPSRSKGRRTCSGWPRQRRAVPRRSVPREYD
jgi:hypothetical protein